MQRITIEAEAASVRATGQVLVRDLGRGYYDDDRDFAEIASVVSTDLLNAAARAEDLDADTTTVTVELDHINPVLDVLELDREAGTALKPTIAALNEALATSAQPAATES